MILHVLSFWTCLGLKTFVVVVDVVFLEWRDVPLNYLVRGIGRLCAIVQCRSNELYIYIGPDYQTKAFNLKLHP
jgi:hypothetical protein